MNCGNYLRHHYIVKNILTKTIPRGSRGSQMSSQNQRSAWAWASLLLRLTNDPPDLHPAGYWPDYLRALAITGLCTAVAFPLSPYFGLVNIVMLYLLGTTLGALRLGRGPSVLLAVANMLAFDFFFVP